MQIACGSLLPSSLSIQRLVDCADSRSALQLYVLARCQVVAGVCLSLQCIVPVVCLSARRDKAVPRLQNSMRQCSTLCVAQQLCKGLHGNAGCHTTIWLTAWHLACLLQGTWAPCLTGVTPTSTPSTHMPRLLAYSLMALLLKWALGPPFHLMALCPMGSCGTQWATVWEMI